MFIHYSNFLINFDRTDSNFALLDDDCDGDVKGEIEPIVIMVHIS